jgi:hypothetical protein
MASPHDAFKALAPIDWNTVDHDDLRSFLTNTFVDAQCLIDSIPLPSDVSGASSRVGRPRSATDPAASKAKAKGGQPSDRAELLRREWKEVQVNPRDNPLGVTVYRMAAKDRRGTWFARRSVHAGVGFDRWRRGMEAEFAESLKVQGGPGEGRIRGIGADKRVEETTVDGCGRVEGMLQRFSSCACPLSFAFLTWLAVYQLSAQFPGPTTPRDFITLLLSSDSAIDLPSQRTGSSKTKHYMVVSRPCIHPKCPQRSGYIRGQYESVEFIREIKVEKPLRRTHSSIDFGNDEVAAAARQKTAEKMNKEAMVRSARTATMSSSVSDTDQGEGRKRGRTIQFAGESENEDEDGEDQYETLVEWLMVTRSDPGGSVPRFMVEKGTPAGIASDADKFLKWVSSWKMDSAKEPDQVAAGLQKETAAGESQSPERRPATAAEPTPNILSDKVTQSLPISQAWEEQEETRPSGFYNMITGALGAVASSLPNPFPLASSKGGDTDSDLDSTNDIDDYGDDDDTSSIHSFHSLASDHEEGDSKLTNTESNDAITPSLLASKDNLGESQSMRSSIGSATALQAGSGKSSALAQHEKELRKLEERHRKLVEKAARAQEKANAKKEKEKEKERQKAMKAKANNKKGKSNNSSKDDVGALGEADGEKEQGEKQEAAAAANNDADEAQLGVDTSNEVALAKLREKHAREVARQEEKYHRELQRLEARRASEQRKADERRRKAERSDLAAELERVRAERDVARKQVDVLREQVGELQAQNTLLVARLGRIQGLGGGSGATSGSGEVGVFLQELKRTDSFRDSLMGTSGSGSGSSAKGQGQHGNGSNGSLAA